MKQNLSTQNLFIPVAEEVIHKSDINDDFEGIYSTIIQNNVLDWIFHSVEIILLIFQPLSTRSYSNLTKELDHPKKLFNIQNVHDDNKYFKRHWVIYLHSIDHIPAIIRNVEKHFAREINLKFIKRPGQN